MSDKLTKKDLRRISYSWSWNRSLAWNYEKMMSLGYLSTLVPFLDRNYKDDEEARRYAYDVHSQFFNSEPNLSNVIIGMDLAIEEEMGKSGIDTAAGVKASLMGPFAGIGDTLFGVIGGTVFGSIAVATAMEGNYIGIALWILWNFFVMFYLRPKLMELGYRQGIRLVTTLSGQLKRFTQAASVLGLTVIGGMIATMVEVKFGEFSLFGTVLDLQASIADMIMPKMGSALVVAVCYLLLGRKGMNSNRLIWLVLASAMVLSFAGIIVVP